jgi:hypothetical protein
MEWNEQWSVKFEEALLVYRTPLFLLTTATFFILLARVFSITQAAIGMGMAFFILGSISLLVAGISAAYSIVRYE